MPPISYQISVFRRPGVLGFCIYPVATRQRRLRLHSAVWSNNITIFSFPNKELQKVNTLTCCSQQKPCLVQRRITHITSLQMSTNILVTVFNENTIYMCRIGNARATRASDDLRITAGGHFSLPFA